MRVSRTAANLAFALIIASAANAPAADVVTEPSIGMELARDIANEGLTVCRKDGYRASGVVVDRYDGVRAAWRDDRADRVRG